MPGKHLGAALAARSSLTDTGITYIGTGGEELFMSYARLYEEAQLALGCLQTAGAKPGDELVLQLEDSSAFVVTFWACVLGGIIPVPLSTGQRDDHRLKLFNVWKLLTRPYMVTTPAQLNSLKKYATLHGLDDLMKSVEQQVVPVAALMASTHKGSCFEPQENDIAFIQFSSGSTGQPKGVVLTHRNLLTNMNAIAASAQYGLSDSMLSWMPLTHDMGLIGFHLNPLCMGIQQYLIPTSLFIRRPAIWLDKASAHRATILCSPNFGYQYLLEHVQDMASRNWDLSAVRIIFNGAEPISVKISDRFVSAMAPFGLRRTAMRPVYGLAEASLAVSMTPPDDPVLSIDLDRNTLRMGDRIRRLDGKAATFVNVGYAVEHCEIGIMDEDDRPLGEEQVGEIQIRGQNVCTGYYKDPERTAATIRPDGWLRTGDLGFRLAGCLYIVGRRKDILFFNGQNFYPPDIESVAQEVPGIELNKIAISGYHNEQTGREEIIAFLLHKGNAADLTAIAASLRERVGIQTGITIDQVIAVRTMPKTTSGKLQRYRLMDQFRNGELTDGIVPRYDSSTPQQATIGPGKDEPSGSTTVPSCRQMVADIWKKTLGDMPRHPAETFFQAGGNSLKAAEMEMALHAAFGIHLPPGFFYEHQTPDALSKLVENASKESRPTLSGFTPARDLPMTDAQKRIYYAWDIQKESIAFNMPFALKIDGFVDLLRLANAIRKTIDAHIAYHLVVVPELIPVFRKQPQPAFELTEYECEDEGPEQWIRRQLRPFDLINGPLYRFHMLRLSPASHILLVDIHHIITDGISASLLVQEIFGHYDGSNKDKRNSESDLTNLSQVSNKSTGSNENNESILNNEEAAANNIDLDAWLIWQNDHGTARRTGKSAWWNDQLTGGIPLLDLPIDKPRPPIFDHTGSRLDYRIDEQLTAQLRQLAAAMNCTLQILLLAAYQVLLARFSGQNDIITGIPVSGRLLPETRLIHGLFVNDLPVRTKIDASGRFSDLVAALTHKMAGTVANQEYLYEDLIRTFGGRRDMSRHPLYDNMFVYQDQPLPGNSRELTLERYHFDPGFAKYDLSMEILASGPEIRFGIEYAHSLFYKATIQALAEAYLHLLSGVIEAPGTCISDLPIISAREYARYTYQSPPAALVRDHRVNATIHGLFGEQVSRTPDHIAVMDGDQKISFLQLDDAASGLAGKIARSRFPPGSVIAILMQRSPAFIIAALAVVKAGHCFLPLDISLPEERLAFILSDSRASLLLVEEAAAHPSFGIETFSVPSHPYRLQSLVEGPPIETHTAGPDDSCYIIYTSGTTGHPKGVIIEHHSIVNYCRWAARHYIRRTPACFALYTSVAFDLTMTSIFTPLITGGQIAVYREATGRSLIEEVIAHNTATIVKTTPAHLRILRDSPVLAAAAGSPVLSLIVGGENLERNLAEAIWTGFGGNAEIFNEYGPTEATVGCMIHRFDPKEKGLSVPIGVPAANTRIYLLDAALRPVAAGMRGEIYIAGEGLARGYLFRDELTSQRFLNDPWHPGERMYRTGDIARRRPEDILEYCMRSDDQVKIHGYRVEPAEIQWQIEQFTGMLEARVVAIRQPAGTYSLHAYYRSGIPIGEEAIREYLAARLPYYMIPLSFTSLPSFPLTSNGKIDLASLPVPDRRSERPLQQPQQPQLLTDKKHIVALTVWKKVLQIPEIDIRDNFFEMGGDSIKAIQIAGRMLEEGFLLTARDILTYHSIEQCCRHTVPAPGRNGHDQEIQQGDRPASPVEAWLLDRKLPHPYHFNQSVWLEWKTGMDIERLQSAFAILIAHHDTLRTNVHPDDQRLYYNPGHLSAPFPIRCFEGMPDRDRLMEWKGDFDLQTSLLLKAAIVKEAKSSHSLLITAHHLLVDGLSWQILLEDLAHIYQCLIRGDTVHLPRKTASYRDYLSALDEYARSEAFLASIPHWQAIHAIPFQLPVDHKPADWSMAGSRSITIGLDSLKTGLLIRDANKPYQTNIQELLVTAWALAVYDWCGKEDLVIELEGHGRYLETLDLSRTVGWFTAMYPVHIRINASDMGQQIGHVKESIRQTPDNGLGYEIWRRRQGILRTIPPTKPELRFNYLGQFDGSMNNELFNYRYGDRSTDSAPGNDMTATIEIVALVSRSCLIMDCTYNKKAHDRTTIQDLVDGCVRRLDEILQYLLNEQEIHLTPSDFDTVDLDQGELDALFS